MSRYSHYTYPKYSKLTFHHRLYTGEGIHHAMEGGKMAAEFLGDCLNRGNFDAEVMRIWHDRWMDKFGNDYKWFGLINLIRFIHLISFIYQPGNVAFYSRAGCEKRTLKHSNNLRRKVSFNFNQFQLLGLFHTDWVCVYSKGEEFFKLIVCHSFYWIVF